MDCSSHIDEVLHHPGGTEITFTVFFVQVFFRHGKLESGTEFIKSVKVLKGSVF